MIFVKPNYNCVNQQRIVEGGGGEFTWGVGDTVVLVSIQVLHGGQTHTVGETLIRLRSEPPSSCLLSRVTHARVTVSWIEFLTFK